MHHDRASNRPNTYSEEVLFQTKLYLHLALF